LGKLKADKSSFETFWDFPDDESEQVYQFKLSFDLDLKQLGLSFEPCLDFFNNVETEFQLLIKISNWTTNMSDSLCLIKKYLKQRLRLLLFTQSFETFSDFNDIDSLNVY